MAKINSIGADHFFWGVLQRSFVSLEATGYPSFGFGADPADYSSTESCDTATLERFADSGAMEWDKWFLRCY
jgi:hypothetical protein